MKSFPLFVGLTVGAGVLLLVLLRVLTSAESTAPEPGAPPAAGRGGPVAADPGRAALPSPPAATLPAQTAPRAPAPARGPLVLNPGQVDLGRVGHNIRRRITFELENRSQEPVTVTATERSCDCITVSFDLARPLAPGERRSGELDVNLGRGFGHFSKHVDFHLAGHPSLVLPVRADFHPGLQVVDAGGAPVREFVLTGVVGDAIPESRASARLLLRGAGRPPRVETPVVVQRRPSGPHPHLEVELEPVEGTPVLTVAVAADHPPGRIEGQVGLIVEGLPLVIPVRGTVHQGIRMEPEYLQMSRITDLDATWTVELMPVDGREFAIERVEVIASPRSAEDALQVETRPHEAGGHRLVVRLKQNARQPGTRITGSLRIETSHPDCPRLELRYFGFVPESEGR